MSSRGRKQKSSSSSGGRNKQKKQHTVNTGLQTTLNHYFGGKVCKASITNLKAQPVKCCSVLYVLYSQFQFSQHSVIS